MPGPGRPPISEDVQQLILRMATENHWRARKIQAERSKLCIELSLATISRYLSKTQPDATSQQRWTTFLRNHRDLIAAMDFFVVPTVHFRLLYVWFAIDHGRRRILHFKRDREPSGSLGPPAASGGVPRRPLPPVLDFRQRCDLLG